MPTPRLRRRPQHGSAGQATVELVALLPLLGVGLLLCWQLVLLGHAAWSLGAAARAVARAHAVGGDELRAARASLPTPLERRVRIRRPDDDGRIPVSVTVPAVVPGLELGDLTVRASFTQQQ